MASFTQLRVLNATGSFGVAVGQINDDTSQLAQTGSIGADNLGESLSFMAAAIRRIHGGDWFSNQAAGIFSLDVKPDGDGTRDLGSAAAEWAEVHVNAVKSAVALDIDAGAGITVDGTALSIDGTDDSNLTVTGASKDLDIAVAGGGTQELRLGSAGTGTAAIHLNASAGGMDIDVADMLDIDVADEITIDTTSADGHIAVTSAHTAGQAILISANADAGSILDIDAGIMDVDVQGALTLDSADDSSFTVTGNGKDLVLAAAGGGAQKLQLDSAGTGTDAIDISAANGGIDVDAAAAVDILAGTTMTIKGAGVSKYGDDTATLDFDGAGAVSETGMTSFAITPSGVLTMQGGGVSKYGDDTATLDFDGAGAVTETGMTSFVITPAGVTTLGGAGLVTLDSSGAANDINIGVEAAAKDIVIGNAASALVDVNALVVDIDGVNSVAINGAGGATFGDDTEALVYDGSGNLDLDAVTLDMDVGGLAVIDVAGNLSIDSTDNSNLSVTGAAKSLVVNAAGGGAQSLQLLSSGSGPTSVQVKGEGGVAIQAGNTKTISIGSGGTAEVMVTPDSTAADSKIKLFAENGTAASVTAANTNALSLQAPAGGAHISADAVILSGSGAQAVTIAGDGSMTSGKGGAGMLFGAAADYANFRGKSLFSAGTTVVGALNALADNITGATATIFTGSITTAIAAGGNATVKKQAGDNAALSPECGIEKAQVYVNGQLLVSSSIGATNDYQITANDTIQFAFDLRVGDMIMVVDRS